MARAEKLLGFFPNDQMSFFIELSSPLNYGPDPCVHRESVAQEGRVDVRHVRDRPRESV